MSWLTPVAWYYGYVSIYVFLGLLAHVSDEEAAKLPSWFPQSLDHHHDAHDFDWPALPLFIAVISLWTLHHSFFLRPWVNEEISTLLPSVDSDDLFQIVSGALLNLVTYIWCCGDSSLGGGVVYSLDWLGASSPSFVARNWLFLLSMAFYTYTEYYALTSGIYEKSSIVQDGPYAKLCRHPMQLSFLCIFWLTTFLTAQRLVFNLLFSCYILVGIQLEERALLKKFGTDYEEYRQRVPMLIPYHYLVSMSKPTKSSAKKSQ